MAYRKLTFEDIREELGDAAADHHKYAYDYIVENYDENLKVHEYVKDVINSIESTWSENF